MPRSPSWRGQNISAVSSSFTLQKKTKKNNNNNVCAYAEGSKFRIVQQTCNQIDQPSKVVIKCAEWLAVDGIYMYIFVIGYINMSDLHTTIVTLCTAASVAKSAARLRRIGRLLLSSCPALGRGLSTRLPKGGYDYTS